MGAEEVGARECARGGKQAPAAAVGAGEAAQVEAVRGTSQGPAQGVGGRGGGPPSQGGRGRRRETTQAGAVQGDRQGDVSRLPRR